jgi:Na+(H+)/acetate symporter ActP
MLNYRNVSTATLLLGIVLMLIGFVMGGFNSVTWAGFIGAGIALTIHGGLAIIGSFVMWSSNAQTEKEDAR